MSDPSKGRIAIKLGGSSSSISKPSRPNPPSSLGKRPRSGAWGHGSDSEHDDDDDVGRGKHEAITGFGANGAESAKIKDSRTEKKEYIIPKQANRNWKADVKAQRRGRNLLPEEARAQQNGHTVETEPADQDKGLKWGLTLMEKPQDEKDETAEAPPGAAPPVQDETAAAPKRSEDDEAIDALLGNAPAEDPASIHLTEDDAYRRDASTAGEASTLADYDAMPVEEFGAALLRGMGWDGKERGPRPKEVKRRQNRLGLGAKELKEAEDLGGWNQAGGKKKSRPRLDEYRREESKKKEGRVREDSYKRERERERDRGRDGHRDRDRFHDRHRDRYHDYDRDRR